MGTNRQTKRGTSGGCGHKIRITNVVTLAHPHIQHKGPLMDYGLDTGHNTIILIITLPALISGFNIRRCNCHSNCFCGENVQENGNYSRSVTGGNWSKTLYNLTKGDCLMPLWAYCLRAFVCRVEMCENWFKKRVQLCFPLVHIDNFTKRVGLHKCWLWSLGNWNYGARCYGLIDFFQTHGKLHTSSMFSLREIQLIRDTREINWISHLSSLPVTSQGLL